MASGINNGKHHTINIYVAILMGLQLLPFQPLALNALPKTGGKWIVVIDPGHGGRDPGSLGQFTKEKNINLAISLKTGKYLEERMKNVKVIYTRDDDSFVDLDERPRIAGRYNADLFISIHSNYWYNKIPVGVETYIMGPAKDEANLAVAMKENEVMLLEDDYTTKYQGFDPKSTESYIIFTLMQNAFQKQSTDLADRIQNELTGNLHRVDRGVKQAGFLVLYYTTMPSILIETGFLTNTAEEKYLNSTKGQDELASAISHACMQYINDIDMRSGISVQESPKRDTNIVRQAVPAGKIIFMVQVATSSSHVEIKPENFRGLTDISEVTAGERFKYATGSFSDYSEAVRFRKNIETIYPDAFVIAVRDNKILPLQQALDQIRKNK